MIQFREISIKEALEMLADDLNNLYYKTSTGSIDCVGRYNVSFDQIAKKQYFRKETIK